jgi:murein DD-endopeptidase MepM/ murein hydrolase activator NlpD
VRHVTTLIVVTLFLGWSQHSLADDVVVSVPESVALGEVFLGRVSCAEPVKDIRIEWLNRYLDLPVDESGGDRAADFLLGTDVLRTKAGKQSLHVRCRFSKKIVNLTREISVHSKDYPEQRLTLPPKMVSPPKETWERIKRERAAVGKALRTVTRKRGWTLPFLRPVGGAVSSVYGVRRFLNDEPRSPHRGVDFRAQTGTPIKATNSGRVVLVGDHYYAGKSVYIDHGLGVISLYFHLSKIKVLSGQPVNKGDVIGLSGKSGRATGPHLHFSLALMAQLADPMPLFDSGFSAAAGD